MSPNSDKQPDRRRFLKTGAALGVGAATGGLYGLGWTTPASAAELGLTKRYPIPGYPGATLPFPTDPGQFLSMGMKMAFGPLQACLCVTPAGVFRMAGMPDPIDATLEGGLGVSIGEGGSKKGKNVMEQAIHMLLHPTDHLSDGMSSALGTLSFRHDGKREAPPSSLSPLDPTQVFAKFREEFFNPFKWPKHAAKFAGNPIGFFQDFLSLFFPAQQDMNFNVKCESSEYPGVVLVNRKTITMANGSAKEFPPRNAGYAPVGTIELVDEKNPAGEALITVEKFDSVVSHKRGRPPKTIDRDFVKKHIKSTVAVPDDLPVCYQAPSYEESSPRRRSCE